MEDMHIMGVKCEILEDKTAFSDDRVVIINGRKYVVDKCNIKFTHREWPYVRAGRVTKNSDGALVDLCVDWEQKELQIPEAQLIYNTY
jgi:hypothetical protein